MHIPAKPRTLSPPPPPQRQRSEGEIWATLLSHLLSYPLRRPFQDLSGSLNKQLGHITGFSLLMAGEVAAGWDLGCTLVTELLDQLQQSTASGPSALTHDLTFWTTHSSWVALLATCLFLDRQQPNWYVRATWQRPFLHIGPPAVATRTLPTVPAMEWAIGVPYLRTWNEVENYWEEERLADQVYSWTAADLATHLILVAPTRVGKTHSFIIPLLEYLDRIEAGVIAIDAKGDDITGTAFDDKYPGVFHLRWNMDDPSRNFPFQPWVGRTFREQAERMGKTVIPEGTSSETQFYATQNRNALTTLVCAHAKQAGAAPRFSQIVSYLQNAELREILLKQLPLDSWEAQALVALEPLLTGTKNMLAGLSGALTPLAHPDIDGLFAAPGTGYTIEDLVREPVRVCFSLPVGRFTDVAPLIGKMIVGQFTDAVLDPGVTTSHLKVIILDEAKHFLIPKIALGMSQSSSHNVSYVTVFQDLSQIRDEPLAEDILANAGLKAVMQALGKKDSDLFSDLYGVRDRAFRSLSATTGDGQGNSTSQGYLHNTTSRNKGRNTTQQQSVGWSSSSRNRADFSAAELRAMPKHHAVIESRDNRGNLRPATLVDLDRDSMDAIVISQRCRLFGPEVERYNHSLPLIALALPVALPIDTPRRDTVRLTAGLSETAPSIVLEPLFTPAGAPEANTPITTPDTTVRPATALNGDEATIQVASSPPLVVSSPANRAAQDLPSDLFVDGKTFTTAGTAGETVSMVRLPTASTKDTAAVQTPSPTRAEDMFISDSVLSGKTFTTPTAPQTTLLTVSSLTTSDGDAAAIQEATPVEQQPALPASRAGAPFINDSVASGKTFTTLTPPIANSARPSITRTSKAGKGKTTKARPTSPTSAEQEPVVDTLSDTTAESATPRATPTQRRNLLIQSMVDEITALLDTDEANARYLATIAVKNKRDLAYIQQLLNMVLTREGVRVPSAYFWKLVTKNIEIELKNYPPNKPADDYVK